MEYEIIRNDITTMHTDCIVLPANTKLAEGSGTSHAIFEKAGERELKAACKKLGLQKEGEAVATLGFRLPVEYIIHAVVPKWKNGKSREYELLSQAYISSLYLADLMECESIAFPLLASGNNKFNKELAYHIADEAISLYTPKRKLKKVFLVVYDLKSVEMLLDLGIDPERKIDDKYVLGKDEEMKPVVEKVLIENMEKAKAFMSKPENVQAVVNVAVNVVELVAKKNDRMADVLGLVKKVVNIG